MTLRVASIFVLVLGLVVGCTSHDKPDLPPSSDTAAIADRITGPDGQSFLREITTAAWDDDGRGAAEIFAWIPHDATSTDHASESRAGQTAHAVATFLADNREALKGAPANSALWQSFSQSLVPYLGAIAGDSTGTTAFNPLDGLNSSMPKTVSLFAAMTKDIDADKTLTDAAAVRAHTYEAAFARSAVADPVKPATDAAVEGLMQAARLRAVIDAGRYQADPKSPAPDPRRAQTEVRYQFASLTARPGDAHINAEFFKDGRLLGPNEIPKSDESIYSAQMSTYLVDYPSVRAIIEVYGRRYDLAAGQ